MRHYVQDVPTKPEAGGVLLGRHILETGDIIVDLITEPMPSDRQGRFRFFRARRPHQAAIDRAWRASGGTYTYLGEWHTHPEQLLLEFKREHEQRIRLLTESREDAQTHVLLLQAPIDGHDVAIHATDAFRAILPQYPAEEDAILIDLSGTELRADTAGFFPLMAQCITARVRPLIRRHAGQPRIQSLSIFALAPIPLLVHFGSLLGDMHRVDLCQRHRVRQDWTWGEEEEAGAFYEVLKPESIVNNEQEVALVLSISEPVVHARVRAALGSEPLVYEIRAREPSRDFLTSGKRLEMFGYEVRKLLYEFRTWHEHHRVVHLFAAVPAPVAIEFGRSLKEFDPPFLVYEYQKGTRTLVPALVVHARDKEPL